MNLGLKTEGGNGGGGDGVNHATTIHQNFDDGGTDFGVGRED